MHKKLEHIIRKILHALEDIIAVITLVVLLTLLGLEIFHIVTEPGYVSSVEDFLHIILTIVVGLEFVRMLVDMTPANTLEVLIVAIARQIIVSHADAVSNVACVLCIAGLFAIKRYLIPKHDLTIEMSEVDEEDDEEKETAPEAKAEEPANP